MTNRPARFKPVLAVIAFAILAACSDVHRACTHPTYSGGMASLAAADSFIDGGDYAQANTILLRELEALGSAYSEHTPTLMSDDTSLSLTAALHAEQRGDLLHAATTRRGVLESRLELFRRYSCTVRE